MGRRTYSDQQNAFLKRHPILDRVILAALFNKEFSENRSVDAIRIHCSRRLGMKRTNTSKFRKGIVPWCTGMKGLLIHENCKKGWFKKGHTFNEQPLNYTWHKKGGFLLLKYRHDGETVNKNFCYKHRYLYEQHHNVKLTGNDVILFKDGNKENFEIDNLIKVSRNAAMSLNHTNFKNLQHSQIRVALINLAEINMRVKDYDNHRSTIPAA